MDEVTVNTDKLPETGIAGNDIYALSDVVVKFTFCGKTYLATGFDLQFSQEVNHKNLPSGEIAGGIINITISGQPDEKITAWMMSVNEKRDGEIHVFNNKGKVNENALMNLVFNDAYCIRYKTILDAMGSGMLTTLVISPRVLTMGNVEYKKRWK